MDRGGPSTVIDFTGPQRVLEDPEPSAPGRRARHGDRPAAALDEPESGRRAAARRAQEADTEDAAEEPRSRRRVGWRKGSDVDEELWPAEAFGGVSDEQFWDDLAADKPLATTARTAQPEPVNRRRRGPLPDLHAGADRVPGGRGSGRSSSVEGASTNPQPRLGADDRTAIQPAVPSSSPSSLPSSPPSSPRPSAPPSSAPRPATPRPSSPFASPTAPMTTQPYPAVQPSTATQPVRAAYEPEPRGRSRAGSSADDDPLTSPAYSLRPKGAVDGRSYPSSPRYDRPSYRPNGQGRPDPLRSDSLRPDPLRSDSLRPDSLRPADPYAAYPYSQQPYGESYGPRSQPGPRDQAGPADDPRRSNGGRSPGRPGGANGNSGARPAYPPVNGHRGPYDPRGYDRRLTSTH